MKTLRIAKVVVPVLACFGNVGKVDVELALQLVEGRAFGDVDGLGERLCFKLFVFFEKEQFKQVPSIHTTAIIVCLCVFG